MYFVEVILKHRFTSNSYYFETAVYQYLGILVKMGIVCNGYLYFNRYRLYVLTDTYTDTKFTKKRMETIKMLISLFAKHYL